MSSTSPAATAQPDGPYYLRERLTTARPDGTRDVVEHYYGPASEAHVQSIAAEREQRFKDNRTPAQDGIVPDPHGEPEQDLVIVSEAEFRAAAEAAQHAGPEVAGTALLAEAAAEEPVKAGKAAPPEGNPQA